MKFYSPLTADFFPNEPDYEDEFYDEYEGYARWTGMTCCNTPMLLMRP